MSITTVICDSLHRLKIQASPSAPELVSISILNREREVLATCTIDAHTADVFAKALAMHALAADAKVHKPVVVIKPALCECHAGYCDGWEHDGCRSRTGAGLKGAMYGAPVHRLNTAEQAAKSGEAWRLVGCRPIGGA